MHALEKDPHQRYQSASEFRQALRITGQELDLQAADNEGSTLVRPVPALQPDTDPFKTLGMGDEMPPKKGSPHPIVAARGKQRGWR